MKIIIPTDFSENAYKAIAYVYEHFNTGDLDITLVHTIQHPGTSRGVMIRIDDIMRADAEKAMNEVSARLKREYNGTPEKVIRHGHLKDWVEQVASVIKPDLIVMGTKGENNIASKLMGSVTESIIRTSKVPVLAIPDDYVYDEVQNITISSSDNSIERPDLITSLIQNMKCKHIHIDVLRVLTSDDETVPRSIKLDGKEVSVEAIRSENVVDGINNYIENNKVDILTLAHSHNSRFDYLFNRSVTKSICAKVKLPLLVIPV